MTIHPCVIHHCDKEADRDVQFHVWQGVTNQHNVKPFKRTALCDVSESKADFCHSFINALRIFRQHQDRVTNQYNNFNLLKDQLKVGEVTIQMDFAENYVCHYKKEMSGVYFSKKQVTVHLCDPSLRLGRRPFTAHDSNRCVGCHLPQGPDHLGLHQVIDGMALYQHAPRHPGPLLVSFSVESVPKGKYVPRCTQSPGDV